MEQTRGTTRKSETLTYKSIDTIGFQIIFSRAQMVDLDQSILENRISPDLISRE